MTDIDRAIANAEMAYLRGMYIHSRVAYFSYTARIFIDFYSVWAYISLTLKTNPLLIDLYFCMRSASTSLIVTSVTELSNKTGAQHLFKHRAQLALQLLIWSIIKVSRILFNLYLYECVQIRYVYTMLKNRVHD